MAANADEIRKHVVRYHIQPAIRKGERTKEVYFRELEKELKQGRERAPFRQAIRAALTTQDFQTQYDATANEYTSITFTLRRTVPTGTDFVSDPLAYSQEDKAELIAEPESKEDIIAKLTERMDELTQDEFENLVQAYARAKGFSSVEVSFTMKMEI